MEVFFRIFLQIGGVDSFLSFASFAEIAGLACDIGKRGLKLEESIGKNFIFVFREITLRSLFKHDKHFDDHFCAVEIGGALSRHDLARRAASQRFERAFQPVG